MTAVYPHRVGASVRPDGSARPFAERSFELMLGPDTDARMQREARRILRQIGYEVHDVFDVHRSEGAESPTNQAAAKAAVALWRLPK